MEDSLTRIGTPPAVVYKPSGAIYPGRWHFREANTQCPMFWIIGPTQ
jgi:hypothetical protein